MKTVAKRQIVTAVCMMLVLAVSTSTVFAYPPDPDNAALLYYQAFLLYQSMDEAMQDTAREVARGEIEPDKEIRKHIEKCHDAIYYTMAASEMQHCNWGLRYSDGFAMNMSYLAQVRQLAFLVIAEARVFAADEAYREALERCLVIRRLAGHVGDETIISLLVSVAVSRVANDCMQDILGAMPPNLETLKWLKNELVSLSSRSLLTQTTLDAEREVSLDSMTVEGLKVVADQLDAETRAAILERLPEVSDEFLERNRTYYTNHMAAVQAVLSSRMPYEETMSQLKQLDNKPKEDLADNDSATLASMLVPAVSKIYGHEMTAKTSFNALRAALELYIAKAETGRLPESLPSGLPKDLFSGSDFGYEKKADGFVLRCRAKDLVKDQIHEYEFSVKN
ncbi:MAG: hypothetical protein JSU70_01445 [Phycisphaerales bacterium]|nr:MAG: hypothetical protein JSU70_01445 [Phycisphaerales bacterium]